MKTKARCQQNQDRNHSVLIGQKRIDFSWAQLTPDSSVLDIVKGYRLRFKARPHQFYHPITNPKSSKDFQAIKQEVNSLLSKGAIKQIPKSQAKFVSRLFTVPKTSGGLKPVINLKPLNQFLHLQTFKMEGLSDLKVIVKPNDNHDRSVRCLYYSSYKGRVKKLSVFLISRSNVSILVSTMLQEHLQNSKPPVGTLRSLGFKIVVYLDDIILSASARGLCIYQGQVLIKTLENLSSVINLEKSNLVPSQVVLFPGFIVDSKKMSFSLPDSKMQSIILSAQTLLNQPKVSLRKLSLFIGMCNASRTAVLEVPLHYRSIQCENMFK